MGIENPVHLLFIAAVALVVLGPKRLPALAKALGQAMREFRASLEAGASQHAGEIEPAPAPPQQTSAESGPPADAA
ncbi:MAG TPA: twin-arginine translocase TatA/TatE family subunit [Solirubrobacteraceae bacterium]|nr:twin-arginine translocase TatA/TatE family subunit [Solirubrobacteraceae bacterium]